MAERVHLGREFGRFLRFLISELRPRGPWLTPFNLISVPVIVAGVVILVVRFTRGLGSVTNLSQEVPSSPASPSQAAPTFSPLPST